MATTFLAPDPIQSKQFIPGGIVPANGGQLFFYLAGTSTKQTVYKDNAAASSWTNPIVLDSGGDLPGGGEVWFSQGVSYKVVFAPATDSDPPVSPYWTKDNLSGINDSSSGGGGGSGEWKAGTTPTFVSGTSFRVSGDQRSTFDVGRRVQASVSGGTAYGTITSSALASGSTAVGLSTSNSIALDSGLTSVNYAFLDAANTSLPPILGTQIAIADPTNRSKAVSFSASSVTASTVVNLNVGTSSGTIAMVEQLSFTQGQCRLLFVSSSQIKLSPYQGNLLPFPSRISFPIASTGVTTSALTPLQAGSTLALLASTVYDVYAFITSNALSLDLYSTAAGNHSTDSATGIEILGGNSTRVYVGKVLTDLTSSYAQVQSTATNGTTGAHVGVLSWFNRRQMAFETQMAIANSILTNIVTEPTQKPRINFITFGDENFDVYVTGSGSATSAAMNISVGVGLDSTSSANGPVLLNTVTGANLSNHMVGGAVFVQPSEGSHFASLLAGCTGNSATGTVSVSSMIRMAVRV